MKKFFLFAVAALAALSVNAKVVSFAGIVNKHTADSAKITFDAGFDVENITAAGLANSDGTAFCAELTQTIGTWKTWDSTSVKVKGESQVYIAFKDKNANKKVAKAWAEYIQPSGKAMCVVITGLKTGDEITITLKDSLNATGSAASKAVTIEGVVETGVIFDKKVTKLTAMGSEVRIYSTDANGDKAAWKLVSVEVPDGGNQAVDNVNAAPKAEKFFRNGQLIIRKNGVEYNALGEKL